MLTDQEIIQKFHQRISYASECKIIELDGFAMTNTQYILYMPCNWSDYEERKHKIIQIAEKASYMPGLIIAGEPEQETLNTIRYDPTLPEHIFFRGEVRRLEMQIEFIDPKVRAYLNRTIFWEIEEPY